MALFVQHGHGKADKINTALDDGNVGGVIFGARNEQPERLEAYIGQLRGDNQDCELLLDPQFYVSTFVPPNDRYLPEYPYYDGGRTASDFTSSRRLREYAQETLEYQVNLGLDALISPSVIFDAFSDRWHQIALNLADASLEYHAGLDDPPPLLLNFIFAEEALAAGGEIDRFLDTVTQDGWDMEGFYLIIARNDASYNQRFDSQRLAGFLYLVYAMSEINGLRVVCGYTDFVGIPLRAAGGDVFATGWSQSLRQFHRRHFIKRKAGGQPPRERYSSGRLFNSILLDELQDIYDVDHLDDVLSGVPLDDMLTGASSPQAAGWTNPLSQQHHWQTLHALDESLAGRVRRDMRDTCQRLREADGLYRALEAEGVQFARNTGKDHLMEWVEAIRDFQTRAGFAAS